MSNYDMGYALMQKGMYSQAITEFSKDIALKPSSSAYANRSFCYAQTGQKSKAIDDLNAAHKVCFERIQSDTITAEQLDLNLIDMTRYQVQLGQLCTETKRFDEAAVYYETAILNYNNIKDRETIEDFISLSILHCNTAFVNISRGNQGQAALDLANALKTAKTTKEKQEAAFAADITGLRQFVELIS